MDAATAKHITETLNSVGKPLKAFWLLEVPPAVHSTGTVYVQQNIEVCLQNHCCSGKAVSIAYSECVLVAIGIQLANTHVSCPALQYFSTLSHKQHDFGKKKKLLNKKMRFFLIFSTTSV